MRSTVLGFTICVIMSLTLDCIADESQQLPPAAQTLIAGPEPDSSTNEVSYFPYLLRQSASAYESFCIGTGAPNRKDAGLTQIVKAIGNHPCGTAITGLGGTMYLKGNKASQGLLEADKIVQRNRALLPVDESVARGMAATEIRRFRPRYVSWIGIGIAVAGAIEIGVGPNPVLPVILDSTSRAPVDDHRLDVNLDPIGGSSPSD